MGPAKKRKVTLRNAGSRNETNYSLFFLPNS